MATGSIPTGVYRLSRTPRRDPVAQQCPKTRSDALDEATQTRHAKRPDHYLCDTVEQLFTHLSSLGVKWSQVQILSARLEKTQLKRGFGEIRSRLFHTHWGYG